MEFEPGLQALCFYWVAQSEDEMSVEDVWGSHLLHPDECPQLVAGHRWFSEAVELRKHLR
ncbi:hypothetical protein GCM10009555_097980 [Acrocarpospora macrocephala]